MEAIEVDGLDVFVKLDGLFSAVEVDDLVRELQWAADEVTKAEMGTYPVGSEVELKGNRYRITSVTVQRFGAHLTSAHYGAQCLTGPNHLPIVLFHQEIVESKT